MNFLTSIQSYLPKYQLIDISFNNLNDVYLLLANNKNFLQYSITKSFTILSCLQDLYDKPQYSDKLYLSIYREQKCIGIIDLYLNYPKQNNLFINLFVLDTRFRHQGIGKVILKGICQAAKDHDLACLQLDCFVHNELGYTFWQQNNFKIIDYRTYCNNNNEKIDIVKFEKYLY